MPRMKSKGGPRGRDRRAHSTTHSRGKGAPKGGRPAGAGHKPGTGGGWRRGPSRPHAGGPKACPMCGAVVPDLKRHIRERHDDPSSHPRD